jgi:hypothetical protein
MQPGVHDAPFVAGVPRLAPARRSLTGCFARKKPFGVPDGRSGPVDKASSSRELHEESSSQGLDMVEIKQLSLNNRSSGTPNG